jgi:hypothetical protein
MLVAQFACATATMAPTSTFFSTVCSTIAKLLNMSERPPQDFLSGEAKLPTSLFTTILSSAHDHELAQSCDVAQAAHMKRSGEFTAHELLLLEIRARKKASRRLKTGRIPSSVRVERIGAGHASSSEVLLSAAVNSSADSLPDKKGRLPVVGPQAVDVLVVPHNAQSFDRHLNKLKETHHVLRVVTFASGSACSGPSLAHVMVMMQVIAEAYPVYDPLKSQCYVFACAIFDMLHQKFDGKVEDNEHQHMAGKSGASCALSLTSQRLDIRGLLQSFDTKWAKLVSGSATGAASDIGAGDLEGIHGEGAEEIGMLAMEEIIAVEERDATVGEIDAVVERLTEERDTAKAREEAALAKVEQLINMLGIKSRFEVEGLDVGGTPGLSQAQAPLASGLASSSRQV